MPSHTTVRFARIQALIDKRDIFLLILMLAGPQDQRLDAALALLHLAQNDDLREEIRSQGGINALLNLFQNDETTPDLRVVASLTVAKLLSSLTESLNDATSRRIVDCLGFLFSSRSVSTRDVNISLPEMYNASVEGLYVFLTLTNFVVDPLNVPGTRQRHQRAFHQRPEVRDRLKVLEITMELIVNMTQLDANMNANVLGQLNLSRRFHIAEHICTVDLAKPLTVQKGLIEVILEWIMSQDIEKVRSAVRCLRFLTSTSDKYFEGWIHSQIVYHEALIEIVNFVEREENGPDVQLDVALVLSSFCRDPNTRDAIMDSNCIPCIITLLRDSSSQEVAFVAVSTLVQLATGGMAIDGIPDSNAFGGSSYVFSQDMWDKVIQEIVDNGAVYRLVEMACSQERGKLRSVSIKALRVLSEDTSSERSTRLSLHVHAAGALTAALQHYILYFFNNSGEFLVPQLCEVPADVVHELYDALCALANFVHPTQSTCIDGRLQDHTSAEFTDAFAEQMSHGLQSLLRISYLPFTVESLSRIADDIDVVDIILQACRSLVALSPFLLSDKAAHFGCTPWTRELLHVFTVILNKFSTTSYDQNVTIPLVAHDLVDDTLQGICTLAQFEPLKMQIIDRCLTNVMELKTEMRGIARIEIATTAVCRSLGFAEDGLEVHLAFNDADPLCDWFCLRRSLLMQAMAREEIRNVLAHTWKDAVAEAKTSGMLNAQQHFEGSVNSISCHEDCVTKNVVRESEIDALFENIAKDADSAPLRDSVLKQYASMFPHDTSSQRNVVTTAHFADTGSDSDQPGLLSEQVFPLNSANNENDWILGHQRALEDGATKILKDFNNVGSSRVHQLLDRCIPSRLLQREILPVFDIRPDASFNFRAFLMPQRDYYSFHEGQLIHRLCKEQAGESTLGDVHWTLGFTNSSIAGKFSTEIVQTMKDCPMINGLSFVRSTEKDSELREDSELANLVVRLPRSITDITFDNVLNDRSVDLLRKRLLAIGQMPASDTDNHSTKQGSFRLLAIRNTPGLQDETMQDFFQLLSVSDSTLELSPLISLKCLDLSGNNLGDRACSEILKVVHSKESRCQLKHLDLSRNAIRSGKGVLKVLSSYVERYRFNEIAGDKTMEKSWESSLQTLLLSSNQLCEGKLALNLIQMMMNDALALQTLDLSYNGLNPKRQDFTAVMHSTISKNSRLRELDLSGNEFHSDTIQSLVDVLEECESGLTFLRFDCNTPPLSGLQRQGLEGFEHRSRKIALQNFLSQKVQAQRNDDEGSILSENSSQQLPNVDEITVLFAAPLVYFTLDKQLHPFDKLDFASERNLLCAGIKEASIDIKLSFDSATSNRLLAAKARRSSCLHYSGHGIEGYFLLEDENKKAGGPHWLTVEELEHIVSQGGGGAPFKFVFVSTCHSRLVGEAFARARVPHVVCCEENAALNDSAALAFASQFYLSLAQGNTVLHSFQQGKSAVRVAPNIRDGRTEMEKFVLLPRDGNHNVAIFKARKESDDRRLRSFLSVKNMMQEDPSPTPPQFFLGRELDMYKILGAILAKRLVNVTGEPGVGRSSLTCAVCHYINDRKNIIMEIEKIFHVRMDEEGRRANCCHFLIETLYKKTQRGMSTGVSLTNEMQMEDMANAIFEKLKTVKALIVFDHTDLLEEINEAPKFHRFLSDLLRETQNSKVLLTDRKPLPEPSIGGVVEHHYPLHGLSYSNSVRLFAKACGHLDTEPKRKEFIDRLTADETQEDLLVFDSRGTAQTKRLFQFLGNGMPATVIRVACSVSEEEVRNIGRDD